MKDLLNTFLNNSADTTSEVSENVKQYFRKGAKPVVMQELAEVVQNEPDYQLTIAGESQPLHLRLGDVTDIPAIVHMEELVYNGYHAWTLTDFENDFRRNPYRMYLILEGAKTLDGTQHIYGIISGRFLARKSHISHLMVHPDVQNKGIGRYLLNRWVQYVEEFEIPKIELEVRETNQHAIYLYEQFGFQQIRLMRAYYHDNQENAWRMMRDMQLEDRDEQ